MGKIISIILLFVWLLFLDGGSILAEDILNRLTSSTAIHGNPFGVMPYGSPQQKVDLAKELGVSYIRLRDVKVDQWTGSCQECDVALSAGLKLVLTVRNGGGGGQPSRPPTDIKAYQKTIGAIIDKYQPHLLVIENEENSGELFYSGTPQEYHRQLKAACDIARTKGIKCTNGGIVSSLVTLLVANYYEEQGNKTKAEEFLKRALSAEKYQKLLKGVSTSKITAQIKKGKELLAGYKTSGADYINFHWYNADPQALEEAVNYLKTITGLPALTNEVGQQKNEDPNQVRAIMQKIVDLKLPYAIWYSIDTPGYGEARALNNPDRTLRSNGIAFREFIRKTFENKPATNPL